MSSIYADRIETAADMIELYMEMKLPEIPDAVTTNQERCTVINRRKQLKEAYEELLTQTEEI